MIVLSRKKDDIALDVNNFEDVLTDGRLTEPSSGKVYRLRDAIILSKTLGRELTNEEMMQFEC